MPRGPCLNDHEKGLILAYAKGGMNDSMIARELGRARGTVHRFINGRNDENSIIWKARNRKLSNRNKRRILREAARTKKSAREIKESLGVNVTVRRVQQILSSSPYLEYKKANVVPYMMSRHKEARLSWSKEKLNWGAVNWRKIIFTDEKKFNLDGPDGLACYWHDLRQEPEVFSKRQQGGDSLMIWGAISYVGTLELTRVKGNMDSTGYCRVLERALLAPAADALGENWTLMHDGASVHRSEHTRMWLENRDIEVLDWPAKSPDINIIENVWGMMARAVYKDGKQYADLRELAEAVTDAWLAIDEEVIRNLYYSIPRRLVSVIAKKGCMTKY